MYNCIIFDIDGTILDTEKAVLLSLQRVVLEELKKSLSFEELRFALGIPGEVTLNKLGITDTINVNRKWNDYLKGYFREIRIFDGIKETLRSLTEMGSYIGIVTSKTKEELKNDFEPFGLTGYFNLIICADDTKKHKPDPEPITKFIECAGVNKSKCIYIGDTRYDLMCAKGADIDFALALWGAKTSSGIDADYILQDPENILSLFS